MRTLVCGVFLVACHGGDASTSFPDASRDGTPDTSIAAGPPIEVSADFYPQLAARGLLRPGDAMLAIAVRAQVQNAPPISQQRFQLAIDALAAVSTAERTNQIGVQKTLVFSSIEDLVTFLPAIPSDLGVDWIGYDMEGGMTPDGELADPTSVQTFAAQVAGSGRKMSWGPTSDRYAALANASLLGPTIAPPVAGAVLQGQRILSMGGLDPLRTSVTTTQSEIAQASPSVRFGLQLFLPTDTVQQTIDGFNAAYTDLGDQLGLAIVGTADEASAEAVIVQLSWRR